MTELEDRISEHAFHEELRETLTALVGRVEIEEEPNFREYLMQMRYTLDRVGSIIPRIDVTVAPTAPLDQASKRLGQLRSELDAFSQDRNTGRLTNALAHAGHVLLEVLRLPRIDTKEDLGDLQEALVSFRRAIGQHLRYAEEEANRTSQALQETKARIEEIRSDLTEQKKRVDAAVGEFQEQYSASEDRRRSQFEEVQAEIQRKASEQQKKLDESEANRASRFETFANELKQSHTDAKEELAEELELARRDIADRSKDFLAGLTRDKEEAEKILGAIAQTGMAKGFQSTANTEMWSMRVWQLITVSALIGFAVVLVYFLPIPTGEEADAFSWALFSQRVLVSLAFAGLGAYGAREAARHSEKERLYRRLELEFASVGPFLSRLSKERQEQVLEQIADRTFARTNEESRAESLPVTANGLVEIIRMTVKELLRKT